MNVSDFILKRVHAWGMEYFFDHVRFERMFFEGSVEPVRGMLAPDCSRPGIGLEFRRSDAAAYAL